MAGVKKVEIVEDQLAVTDCGQSEPTYYDIPCGCEDDTPSVPPPVQDPAGTTPCRVADYVSKQILGYFEKFIPALNSFGTGNFGTNVQTACNQIGLAAYVIEFNLWIQNLSAFVGINQVVTQYYAWGAKQTQLQCWLLGCLPSTGEMSEGSKQCWREKMQDGKTTFPPYAAFLEALYGMTSIIPVSKYQELANIGSTVPAVCTTCTSSDQPCSPGEHADFRQAPLGWTGFSGHSSQFPLDPEIYNSPNFTIDPATEGTYGFQGVYCTGTCPNAIGIVKEFDTPIKLCEFYYLVQLRTEAGALYGGNSSVVGVIAEYENGSKVWVTGFYFSYTGTAYGNPNRPREQRWESNGNPLIGVKKIYMIHNRGGGIPVFVQAHYNDDSATAQATYPTLDGVPYVAKPPVSVPAGVNQAGWDALVATEPAGRIYEFPEGTYNNLAIIPRAGDVLRAAPLAIVTLDGGQILTGWLNPGSNLYRVVYNRTIVQAGPVIGGYTIANDPNYPRANWNIAVFRDGVPLRHVAASSGGSWVTGCYSYNTANGNLDLYDDPTGHIIIVTHTRNAVKFQANNIILENLIFQHYASVVQEGAITTPDPDVVEGLQLFNVRSNWNAGAGARIGAEKAIVQECDFSDNGQLGLSYGGSSAKPAKNPRILSNTSHRNNFQRVNPNWESGGKKGTYAEDVINDGNETNDNIGKGNWTDLWIRRLLFIRNAARRNTGIGLFIERTIDFDVRECLSADNISNGTSQPQNGQIVVSNSQAIDYAACYVRGSTVIHPTAVGSNAAGGIGVQQTAGDSVAPNYPGVTDITRKIIVEDCDHYYRTPLYGRSGEYYSNAAANVGDRDTFYAAGNVIRQDNRHHGDITGSHFQTNKTYPAGASNQTFAQYQATGMETDTTFDAATVPSELEG